jgi:dTDP-4-amino-4,6-dideoxygalactose transaminase
MVPFLDLKAQYRDIKPAIMTAISAVLDSSQYVLGQAVADFEGSFAAHCQADHAVAVNSGTSALHLALLAAGVGPGDEVITTPATFVATTAAILYTGARPIMVDIDPVSHNMDPNLIEAAITPRTKAILPVHLHGLMAEMDPILDIAAKNGLTVIEDAAQAHGAEYRKGRAGSLGTMGCFSFYPGKNLGAYGEGGAIVTSDPEQAKTLRTLRDWGLARKHQHVMKGYNYRMDGIQGAVLGVKLNHLEQWTEARRSHAAHYDSLLDQAAISRPVSPAYCRHVYHVYAVRIANRDRIQEGLAAADIYTNIHYPLPVHLQPAYADLGYGPGDFPKAEAAGKEFLSLPMFPELTKEQVEEVVGELRRLLNT